MFNWAQNHKPLIGDVLLVLMTVIWGSTFFLIKEHLAYIDPVGMLFYRFGIASVILLPFLMRKKVALFKQFHLGFIVGVFLWLIYVPQNIGMLYTTASNSGFITGMFVAFVPVFLILFFKQVPPITRIVAAGMAFVGLWFLTGGIENINKGDVITLITPVAAALYILYSDKYLKQGFDPLLLCFQTLLTVSVLSLAWMLVWGSSFAIKSVATYWVMAYFIICATLMTFVVHMYVQKISTPMKVGIIFALEPVFTAIFAWMFIDERLAGWQWLGAGLIVAAMILSEIPVPGKKKLVDKQELENFREAA